MKIETTILKQLIKNDEYGRKVLPFLKGEYFQGVDAKLFEYINDFYTKYNAPPTPEVLLVEVNQSTRFREGEVKEAHELIDVIKNDSAETNQNWVIDKTEQFCQERAIYNAVAQTIAIMDGKEKNITKGAIPQLLQDALAVCFDPNIGHDYLEDAEERFAYYHAPQRKVPFDLHMLNKITNGGASRKTLNMVMAGTGIGKTIFLCHLAAAYLSQGANVLYITLEMAENEIAKRIDGNLLNIRLDDLVSIPKSDYDRRIGKLKEKITSGKLIIKEFPTAGASVLHFEHLVNELSLKKNFKPDVIIIDYVNICLSSRLRSGTNGMYQYVKSITEEIRGMFVKLDVIGWSATQVNRNGFVDSDPEMDATSESFGLPMTVDLLICLIASEALAALQQIMVKQLKNRYRDENIDKRFVLGLDKSKMQFSDVTDKDDLKRGNQEVVRSETGEREELPWEEYKERLDKLNKGKSMSY